MSILEIAATVMMAAIVGLFVYLMVDWMWIREKDKGKGKDKKK